MAQNSRKKVMKLWEKGYQQPRPEANQPGEDVVEHFPRNDVLPGLVGRLVGRLDS